MAPFYLVFILIALLSFTETIPVAASQRKVGLLGIATVLIVFCGLRYQPDFVDYQAYADAFGDIVQKGLVLRDRYNSSAAIFEPGFNVLLYVASIFSSSPTIVFLLVAIITVSINVLCYKKYSSKYFIFATLFYFTHTFIVRDMTQIRAGIGAAILLYSIQYIERENLWKFLLAVFLASTFHLACAIFLLIYPLYKLNWSLKTWIYIVVTCFLIAHIAPFGKILLSLPTGGIFKRISDYMWMVGDDSRGVLTNPTILKQLFFVMIGLGFYNTLREKIPHFRVLFVPYILSVCWLMVWHDFPIVAGRLATFFSITEVIIIPSIAMTLVTSRSRPLMGAILVLLALTILYLNGNTYLAKVEGLLPYQFAPFYL